MAENPYESPKDVPQSASPIRGAAGISWLAWGALTVLLVPAVGWLAGAIVWTSGFTRIDNETLARWATLAAVLTGLLVLLGSMGVTALVLLKRRREDRQHD